MDEEIMREVGNFMDDLSKKFIERKGRLTNGEREMIKRLKRMCKNLCKISETMEMYDEAEKIYLDQLEES